MSEQQQVVYNVGVLCISTNKYKIFAEPLLEGLSKHFLPNHNVTLFLFTDEIIKFNYNGRIKIVQELIPSYRFPEATLLRFKIFKSRKYYECDYLFYIDIDMAIVADIGDEVLKNLVAVVHPGFYNGGGSWETREESETYVPPDKRKKYYAGGFQGGMRSLYYAAIIIMDDMIERDKEKGIIPIWHDESAWNAYLSALVGFTELSPSYVMPEQEHLQKLWGIYDLPKKILALEKNHEKIRS